MKRNSLLVSAVILVAGGLLLALPVAETNSLTIWSYGVLRFK